MNTAKNISDSGSSSPFQHQYHPVDRVIDVFCKAYQLERTSQTKSVGAVSQSPCQSQHGTQAEISLVAANTMNSEGTPQLPGVSNNGSSFPEAKTSFQSSTPRTVPTASQATSSAEETDQNIDCYVPQSRETIQPSREDSISEELSHSLSSQGNMSPLLASTPIKEAADGRNVSLTKMLMSTDQFMSLADPSISDSETMSLHSPTVMDEKHVLPKATTSKEILQYDMPPTQLEPSSSTQIIEKYSSPGALTDCVYPCELEKPSAESTHSLKLPLTISEFGMREIIQNRPVEEGEGRSPSNDMEKTDDGGDKSSTDSKYSQQEITDEIHLQRLDSEVKIRTIHDASNVQDKKYTTQSNDVMSVCNNIEKDSSKKNVSSEIESENTDKCTRSERKGHDTSGLIGLKKLGTALGRGSSVSEFKTASVLLHEKQRKNIERKLIVTKERTRRGVLSQCSEGEKTKTDTSSRSQSVDSGKFDTDSKSTKSERNPSFRSLESDVFSHFSGQSYTTPSTHLQKHVDKLRNVSEKTDSYKLFIRRGNKSGDQSHSSVMGGDNGNSEKHELCSSGEYISSVISKKPVSVVCRQDCEIKGSQGRQANSTNSALEKDAKEQTKQTEKGPNSVVDYAGNGGPVFTTPCSLQEADSAQTSIQQGNNGVDITDIKTASNLDADVSADTSPKYGAVYKSALGECSEKTEESSAQQSNVSLIDHATPSQLLKKLQECERGSERSPEYGVFNNTTPSELMERQEKNRQQKESQSIILDYKTPSQPLKKHQKLQTGHEVNQGNEDFDYSAPSHHTETISTISTSNGMQSRTDSGMEVDEHGLEDTCNRYVNKQMLDQAWSDLMTHYFKTLSETLISTARNSQSSSEFDLIKLHSQYSVDGHDSFMTAPESSSSFFSQREAKMSQHGYESFMTAPESGSSFSCQKEPMSSQPLPSCYCGSSGRNGWHHENCTFSRSNMTTDTSRNTSRDTGFESNRTSISSLGCPDSLLSNQNSKFKMLSNSSVVHAQSDKDQYGEELSSPQKLHSAVSASEIFFELYSATPYVAQEVLGPEFAAAMKSLRRLYRGSSSSVLTNPSATTSFPSESAFKADSSFNKSKNTSRDAGIESNCHSVSSLEHADSVLSAHDSRFQMMPNPSFHAHSDDEQNAEEPSTSSGPHSVLSVNDMFWELYSANPGLAQRILGPQFAAAVMSWGSLYRPSSSSILSNLSFASSRTSDYPVTLDSNVNVKDINTMNQNEKNLLEKKEKNSQQPQSVSDLPDCTTPSKLVKKCEEYEEGGERSLGYGVFDYSTPSNLLERHEEETSTYQRQSVSGLPDYTTPSQLLKKRQEREGGGERSPGYGVFDYSTPSNLLERQEKERARNECKNVSDLPDYTTPSQLLKKRQEREGGGERSPGYGVFDYSTPSNLLERQEKERARHECKNVSDLPDYTTPSQLLKKRQEREGGGGRSPGYGVFDYSTPSNLLERQEKERARHECKNVSDLPDYTTPSQLLKKRQEREGGGERSPGYGVFDYSTPSNLLERQEKERARHECKNVSDLPDYTTPSQLLKKRQEREGGGERSPGYGVFDYSTPSNLLERQEKERARHEIKATQNRQLEEGRSSVLDYTTPSQMLKKHQDDQDRADVDIQDSTQDSVISHFSYVPQTTHSAPQQFSQTVTTAQVQEHYHDTQDEGLLSDGQQKSSSTMLSSTRAASPDIRNFLVEKEKLESQVRKLQVENSTLQTENKLMKEKFNRATARIGELEQKVCEAQDEMEALHTSMTAEINSLCEKAKAESKRDVEQLQARVVSLTHHNESLKSEVFHLGKQLESTHREIATVRENADRSRAVDGFKFEIQSLKSEVEHVKQLLQQSEKQVAVEMERSREAHLQVVKLTEVRNLLQQQLEMGGTGTAITEKQVQALEQRLRVTEDRLHQERADRANTLSSVEEKLLEDNAHLQSTEKELLRKLQREKDKARNLDQRCRELKVENENLRLALPLDESCLIKDNNYDIPNNINSSHRQETKQVSDIKYILSEVERDAGLSAGQEKEIICHLWNTFSQTQRRLRQWEINLHELELLDGDLDQGLQNLREMKDEYEVKMRKLEEQMDDIRSEKIGFENMYKEQLSGLVKEKHEACARLKTLEDMLDALRKENDTLRLGLTSSTEDSNMEKLAADHEAQIESLTVEIHTLEGKTSQLKRDSQRMETEMETLNAQLVARDIELEETKSELQIARSQRGTDDSDNRKQEKIDQLTAQVNSLQEEVRSLSERLSVMRAERSHLERQVEDANHQLTLNKSWAKENRAGGPTGAKVSILESELAQKDNELIRMTSQYREIETQLQHTKQDLFFHQQNVCDLETQVESLEQQLAQRGQLLDTMSGKEREQLQQLQMVKDSLDAVTNSLNQRTAEFKVVQMELSRERSRRECLEKQVQGEQLHGDPDADVCVSPVVGSAMKVRAQELEAHADRLRGELLDAGTVLQGKEEELSAVRTELVHTREDLEREKGLSCQVAAEKVALQQQLQALCEDRNSLLEEKDQAEEDLVKLESKLQEVVHKFQMDANNEHGNFTTNYKEPDSSEGKQMLSELKSLRLLIEGKEKEAESQNDRISRLQMETGFLHRRIELLRQENQYNREDVHRLSHELITKMKEKSVTADLNVHLLREKTSIQQENHQLARDIEREKNFVERQKAEMSEIIRKMEKSESGQRSIVQELHQKEGDVASLETELRQARKENSYTEAENQQLKIKLEHLKNEVTKLTSINSTIENRLEMERDSLSTEKTNYNKKKEELTSTQHKLDTLQREQSMLLENLSAERKSVEQLRNEISSLETTEQSLKEQVTSLQVSVDSQRGQNLALKENMEQMKKEKTSIFNDYQDVCRQLGEKEKKVSDMTDKCERQVEAVRRDAVIQRSAQDQERAVLEKELVASKEEINDLNEKLKQKDIQLTAFGHTLTELEDTIREKKALEMKLEKLESTTGESKLVLEAHRAEIVSLKERNGDLQESLAKAQVNYLTVQEQLKSQTDTTAGQILHLKQQVSDMRNQQDGERAHLKEALNQTETKLQSLEMNLKNTTENKDQVVSEKERLEKTLVEIRGHLSEEIMAKKLLEQKTESQAAHLESIRKKKHSLEEKVAEMQAKVTTQESELRLERERVMTLSGKVQEFEASAHGNQSAAMAKQEQVEILQSEVGKLQQLLESQKHQLGAKFRKANLELKQQLESYETEKTKLSQEAQKLSVSLEQAREQVAIKNRENLKLQQDILLLEDQVRDNTSQLKQAQESLRMEEQLQSELSTRFSAQEDELKRLRAFLAKKAEEGADGESKGMWHEMNRVIQDLSREMHQHMAGQQNSDKEARDREIKLANSYKKQISKLDSELNTERALHQITKSSAKALEEDNARLRQQLLQTRRKSSSPEKKYKNHSEEINEIIARSQSRAHAMLSSASYLDGTFRNINPTRDYNTNSHPLDRSQSPDTASQISDISFGSTSPVYLAFLNSSGNLPGSGNVTPKKSPR